MKKTCLRRSLTALVTACAVLFTMANPASATVVNTTITSGAITVTKTGWTNLVIPLAGDPCAVGTMDVDISSTAAGTLTATTFSKVVPYLYSGTTYYFVLTLRTTGSVAGSYDHSTGLMTGLVVPLQIRTYTQASACTPGTLLCTWNTSLTMGSTSFTAHSTSSTTTLTGTGTNLALGGACAAPFTSYTGGAPTISMNVHFT